MIASLLLALFATVAVTSFVALADGVLRSRNAFRLLRGDLARIDTFRNVTVRFEGVNSSAPMPVLRPAAISAARAARRPAARVAERLRAAA
ncbi:hypothetical protein GCM10011515_06320 [Tsuneonella deserti]|uniref:Uncharacterized protein n=1 Tax=Tsuneonella deserti TaxID=2035528 RepID=A0ABQ1S4M3_9SPHN|nr:hypothetical protein [Tsuneonella deserti]GGD89365.1 hypothetical protein GCM10011515_06320 [Tsuneonella deserti]